MLHLRLFDTSIVSLGAASGIAAWNLPQPVGLLLGGSIALASLVMLRQRDGIAQPPRLAPRSRLAPFESRRELVREPDPVALPANGNLTPYQAGRSEFRLAPVTDHVFRDGDKVEFIFDSWDEGELHYAGEVVEAFRRGCKVKVSDELTFYVDRECLVLIEAAQ